MPGPKPLDPSSSPRAMLGAELRHKREEAGLTQEELGRPLFVSGSFIGQLEAGARRMQMEYAVKMDEILETDGYFARNCEAATKSKYPITSRRRRRRKPLRSPSRSTRRS